MTKNELPKLSEEWMREIGTDQRERAKTKVPVTLRAALARMNRKRLPYSCIKTARSAGEKQIGRWLLVEHDCITSACDDIAVLEDWAREDKCLAEYETIVDAAE